MAVNRIALAIAALLFILSACTPPVAPDAPTDLSATAGNASLAIAFTLADDGGSPITSLEHSLDDGASWFDSGTTASPVVVTGLANDEPATVRLRATNVAGTGPASDPVTATPTMWPFATRAGGARLDVASAVATFADGSALVVGEMQGAATFGAATLVGAGDGDAFVAKVAPDGTWAWATRAGGENFDAAQGVATLADGSAIVAGYFTFVANFGGTPLTGGAGFENVFVAKLDPTGAWLWTIAAPSGSSAITTGVDALPDGGAIVTGSFDGSATFGTTTLTSTGVKDAFVAKTDPDGSWAWATRAGGSGSVGGTAVGTLADGGAIVTGTVDGSATFGTSTLTSTGGGDAFVARIGPDGAWIWATRAGGAAFDGGTGVGTLADGGAIVTGTFGATVAFGTTSLTSAGGLDVFVGRIEADGSWAWATRAGGAGSDGARAVSALADGSAIVAGGLGGDATFGATTLTGAGPRDAFVAGIDPDGSWAWAARAESSGTALATGVAALADGSAIVTGAFADHATFGSISLASGGEWDAFVAKVDANAAP